MISKVRKRNGKVVPFRQVKITDAIKKAFIATRTRDDVVRVLSNKVKKILNKKFKREIPGVEDIQDTVEEVLLNNNFLNALRAYVIYRERHRLMRLETGYKEVKFEPILSLNAIKVLQKRYLLRDEDGNIIETPRQLFYRVAKSIAAVDKKYRGNSKKTEKEFYKAMKNLEFIPNSPTLFNAGTGKDLSLSACFVLPIEDSLESIFNAVKDTGLIEQCLTGDTLVMTERGLTKLSSVNKEDIVLSENGRFLVSNLYNNGVRDTYKIITEHGYSLEGTARHRIMVVNEDGDLIWRKIGELKKGDWVALDIGGWFGGDLNLPMLNLKIKNKGNKTRFRPFIYNLPTKLTRELAELIGFYVGDGSNHRDGIRFTVSKKEKDLIDRIMFLTQNIFPRHITICKKQPSTFEVSILSRQIKEWLYFLGVKKLKAINANVPNIILRGTEETAAAFLRGLFSTDSCIDKRGYITFSSSSKSLIKDAQVILLHLGIPTRFYINNRIGFGKRSNCYCLSICSREGLINFKEKINFASRFKRTRLEKLDPYKIFTRERLIIPNQKLTIKLWYKSLSKETKKQICPCIDEIIWRNGRGLTKQKLLQLRKMQELPKIIAFNENLFYTRIEKIEYVGQKEVWDLNVPFNHSYIANGFVSHNSGGGVGFSFSKLRPKGDIVRSTMGVASGPISFMQVFDMTTEVIKQGGKRRGAMMGILRVDHPDILEFISVKQNPKLLTNFNISVSVTDKFMEAVQRNKDYELINPRTKKAVRKLNARKVFDFIVRNAWLTGDPGLIFIDRINKSVSNSVPSLGPIESTNPCSEQPLYPFESCVLGSINLVKIIENKKINWKNLGKLVKLGVHFLDNVIDAQETPIEEINKITRNNRRIGLGVMGWADALIKLGIRYNSNEAIKLANKLMKFIQDESRAASIELAEKRGNFPNFDKSIWKKRYKSFRNAAITTIAPTGSISTISGCSGGIEPLFAVSYIREVLEGARLLEFNPEFENIAREKGFYSIDLMKKIARFGSIQKIKNIPNDVKKLFITALDIKPEWHIKHQAAFQKYTDSSISKTINLPKNASIEDVKKAYLLAYKLKCKGITIYRYGSKKEQVLYIKPYKNVTVASEYSGGSVCTECMF